MFLKLQVFHFPRNKSKSHVFSFFKKRPSKLFNYRKTNICIPQEIFLFSTFDYSNLSFHFSNNQDKKKTLFTINKKKKKGKKTTSKVSKKQTSSKQRMNFLKYLQLPIFLIAFHFNASIHHRLPFLPSNPRSYLSSDDQFQTGETFLNAHCGVLLLAVI